MSQDNYNFYIILLSMFVNAKASVFYNYYIYFKENLLNDALSLGKCMETLHTCIENEEEIKFAKSIAPKRTAKCVYEKSISNMNPNWSVENLLCNCWNSTENAVYKNITKFLKNQEKWEIIMLYGEPYTEEALTEDQNFSSLSRYDRCLPKTVDCLKTARCKHALPMAKVSKCLSTKPDATNLLDEMMTFANCFGEAFKLNCMQVHN